MTGRTVNTRKYSIGQVGVGRSRREPNSRNRYAEITAVAARLFHSKGYHATSMDDIAQAVGLQKGSLYHYINGKEELLLQILDGWVERTLQPLSRIVESSLSPREKLKQAVRNHIENCMAELDEGFVSLQEHKALPEPLLSEHIARRDAYEALFERILNEGIRAGDFPGVDVKMALFVIVGAGNSVVQWYRPNGRLKALQVVEWFVELLVDRMLAPNEKPNQSRIPEREDDPRAARRAAN